MKSMDYSVAEMSCVLNASVQCEACKAKVQEILQNIYGIYTITMDSEDGSVRICGRVNPRTFLKVIEKSGKHAEVKSIRFDGEAGDRRYYPYGDDPTNQLSYPHSYQSFPEQSHWFDRTYPNLPRPQPYPWQLMLPQPQPQPVPWPVIWPGWPPHQDNPFLHFLIVPLRVPGIMEWHLKPTFEIQTSIKTIFRLLHLLHVLDSFCYLLLIVLLLREAENLSKGRIENPFQPHLREKRGKG